MQIDELIERLDMAGLDPMWAEHCELNKRTVKAAAQALRDLKASADALAGYAGHKRECPIVKGWGQAGNCKCGLDQALAAYREKVQ